MVDDLPDSLTVIFDGWCGMCTRAISWIERRDTERRIVAVPCQSDQTLKRFGVTPDDCAKSVWAVTPGGERVPSGQATALVLAVLMQQRWLVTFGRLPGCARSWKSATGSLRETEGGFLE